MSTLLTPAQIAEIRELVDAAGPCGSHWEGCSAAHPRCAAAALLSHAAAQAARIEELEAEAKRLREVLSVLSSDTRLELNGLDSTGRMSRFAYAALLPRTTPTPEAP